MDNQELLAHIDRQIATVRAAQDANPSSSRAVATAAAEFVRVHAGEKTEFFRLVKGIAMQSGNDGYRFQELLHALENYRNHVAEGWHEVINLVRQAQMDTVSDFLGQADTLLSTEGAHPVCAAVLVGASLEAFLREWVEAEGISAPKVGIDGYAEALRKAEKITKQDVKDITSWAGRRNDAAHGKFDEVADARNIRQMLDGVNLFMRKYTPNK